jgi:hypothetical protein
MPDWYEDAATLLVEIAKQDKALYREILRALKRIERNPLIGLHTLPDYQVYYDPERRFRITYNHNAKLKESIVIVNLVLQQPLKYL